MRAFVMISCIASALLFVRAQQLISPCPDVFSYEPIGAEKDRWYGVIQLTTDINLDYVFVDIDLDRKAELLGNWFGEVSSEDNKHFVISNRNTKLGPLSPTPVRIFVKYSEVQIVPTINSIQLNGRNICKKSNSISRPASTQAPPVRRPASTATTTRRPIVGNRVTPEANPNSFEFGTNPNNVISPSRTTERPGNGGPSLSWITVAPMTRPNDDEDFFESDFVKPNRGGSNQNRPAFNRKPSDSCGLVAAKANPLITHGQKTTEGQWPWHAAIYRSKGIDLTYICGASLISKRHVVTAAHCVTRRNTAEVISNVSLMVYFGKYNLRVWSTPNIQVIAVSDIFVHFRYNHTTYQNDVAVLKLTKDVEYTDWVRPVCLWEGTTLVNGPGTVVGWGYDDTGRVTEELTQASMPIVNSEVCLKSYPEFFGKYYPFNTSYCAGFLDGVTVCNGDSGGGMVFTRPNTNPAVWQLRGLVSLSVALQDNVCDAKHYALFTDLVPFRKWITSALAN